MKSQVNIEYIFAISLFIGTISFLTLSIISRLPAFHREATNEILNSASFQVSEILIFDAGNSTNYDRSWHQEPNFNDTVRLGLSSGTAYVLDLNKISALNNNCISNYTKVKELLGLDERQYLYINMTYLDGTPLLTCRPNVTSVYSSKFFVKRFATVNNRIVEAKIGVVM